MINNLIAGCALILLLLTSFVSAAAAARVTLIEGTAEIFRPKKDQWKPLRVNMPLRVNDQIKTGTETLVEITYKQGVIVRLDEQTHCCVKKASDIHVSTSVSKGNVWVNMKRLASSGRTFEVSTPTAVAAIRGTIFQVQSLNDSTADVAVYDGKVAVGLSDAGKARVAADKGNPSEEPHEVPGPYEIPGPFEVTLDQWREIVAGQRITVRKDGRFAITDISPEKEESRFEKKNRAIDAHIEGAK